MRPLMQLGAFCILGHLIPYSMVKFKVNGGRHSMGVPLRPTACHERTHGSNLALFDLDIQHLLTTA